ncbi:MAG: Asp-tRNA(Asn)/Glu-tRNA(Gln) amidotransferase subunit GatA [Holosporales bacterium]|jgi:aspartyl-tRNA(Asn)/glutamyl-tRNA(Gln) amidotransferase subunit A|nr:Asp-tRNA(Asn)/Glu-tRNA(Gln) amidotransferase subunit GatA [Holosporales bacterium]
MNNLTELTLSEARDLLRAKKISAAELTAAFLKRIEAKACWNAFITVTGDLALAQAKESDTRLARGEIRALEGLPIAYKDLFCTKGVRTTAGSRMLESFIPPYESGVTQRLKDSGAVMLGKTNMDEFAMGSANVNSCFGSVINPWKAKDNPAQDLVPGGSSGGSSAAVVGRLCLGATGSDTGGSVRQPAAYTGVVGIKPTYGRCSRWGMVAFASSLDQAGALAKSVKDSAIMLQVMSGYDPRDSTSANVGVPDFEKSVGQSIKGLKVGLPGGDWIDQCDDSIKTMIGNAAAWLKSAGAEALDVSMPHIKHSLEAYYIIAPAEASTNLSRYDGVRFGFRAPAESIGEIYQNTRREGLGAEVRRRILIGAYVLSAGHIEAYYQRAQKVRALIKQDFSDAFSSTDIILMPTAPSGAFAIGEKQNDPVTMYLNDIFTVPANIAGLPAISIPAGVDSRGLPLGIQLIASSFNEEALFKAGCVIESSSGFVPWREEEATS